MTAAEKPQARLPEPLESLRLSFLEREWKEFERGKLKTIMDVLALIRALEAEAEGEAMTARKRRKRRY